MDHEMETGLVEGFLKDIYEGTPGLGCQKVT